jgi:hypothetical protein
MHRKEENLTENRPYHPYGVRNPINEEYSSLFMNSIWWKAKTKVETSSLRNLKILSRNLNEIVLSDFHLCSHIVER